VHLHENSVDLCQVARNLQDRLALANFKAQHGWQNRTLRTIEPEITEQLRRKRPYSSGDVLSDSSSNASEEYLSYNSSPLTGPSFSDDMHGSNQSRRSQRKEAPLRSLQTSGSRKRFRSLSNAAHTKSLTENNQWKQTHHLAQSSPVFHRPRRPFSHMNQSFVSDAATVPESNRSRSSRITSQPVTYEEEDDLPVNSFSHCRASPSMIASSPPRTPSPSHKRSRKHQSKETGADLLLYLANSPSRSPAIQDQPSHSSRDTTNTLEAPSTPPSQHTSITTNNLPSSFLSTPNTNTSNNLALFSTPGQQFNFADFVNVTPSPAQAPWGGRTPGLNKTPTGTRAAWRGLNFDALVPPPVVNGSGSPMLQREKIDAGGRRGHGLALELGDKLMPRT
jgi:Whi5 like